MWRGLRQTQAEETNLKLFKMNGGFLFEVLRLADCSGILGAFNQSGPLTSWLVLDKAFKIWAWIFSQAAPNNINLL